MFCLFEEPCALGPLVAASMANVRWAEWGFAQANFRKRGLKGQKTQVKHVEWGSKTHAERLLGKVWFGRRLDALVGGTVCRVSEPHAMCRGTQTQEPFGDKHDRLKNTWLSPSSPPSQDNSTALQNEPTSKQKEDHSVCAQHLR